MQLGFSVAGGGDNLVDGKQDLLMGAPTYEAQDELGNPMPDAGLVAQTASTMPNGIIESCTIGISVNGVLYTGAAAGDQLGTAVVGIGDVTGDGFEEVALGAPFSDPLVNMIPVADAGTVYVVNGTVPADLNQGIIEIFNIGVDVAGTQLTGTEEEEHAGSSLSFGGDLSGDDNLDFLVGAPDRDVLAADDNAGTVYIILESTPGLPADEDNDGVVDGLDCASTDPQLWATPGVVRDLLVRQSGGVTFVSWTEPVDPGTILPLRYDTVRSDIASDFVTGAVCVETDGSDTESTDLDPLPSGQAAYYLARAQNGCGDGLLREGTFGPRNVIACP